MDEPTRTSDQPYAGAIPFAELHPFALTPDEIAHLATLEPGGDAWRAYVRQMYAARGMERGE